MQLWLEINRLMETRDEVEGENNHLNRRIHHLHNFKTNKMLQDLIWLLRPEIRISDE